MALSELRLQGLRRDDFGAFYGLIHRLIGIPGLQTIQWQCSQTFPCPLTGVIAGQSGTGLSLEE